jgi:hypothetical protein
MGHGVGISHMPAASLGHCASLSFVVVVEGFGNKELKILDCRVGILDCGMRIEKCEITIH